MWLAALLAAAALPGCSSAPASVEARKQPRPVSTVALVGSRPAVTTGVTGQVVPWKTERIAFEVEGRVRRVVEAGDEVEGRVASADGAGLLAAGTPLAQLDDERARIAVRAAEAAVEVARRQIEAMRVDLEQRLPARVAAAEAERKLAAIELERSRRLAGRSAATVSDLDQAETRHATASAELAAAEAELAAREAEIRSLDAQAAQAEQRLEAARRDLADSVLFSPFGGQVALTHAVPGSFVRAGDPVATVQMMDPVAVDFEVSAEASRRFREGDTLRVLGEGGHRLDGMVYRTAAVANPETRTFTVRLLVRNRRRLPERPAEAPTARTPDLLPLDLGEILGVAPGGDGDGSRLFVAEKAVRRDAEGAFLWRVTNRRMGEPSLAADRVLRVEKLRVDAGPERVPFLGSWHFVPVAVRGGVEVDPARDLVAGELAVDAGEPDAWEGDAILLDRPAWLLRPGDVVRVELDAEPPAPGFYVPMKALRRDAGRTYAFLVDDPGIERPAARRVEVRLADDGTTFRGDSALRRVEPVEPDALAEGARLVVEGAHYLVDGDEVVAVRGAGGDR